MIADLLRASATLSGYREGSCWRGYRADKVGHFGPKTTLLFPYLLSIGWRAGTGLCSSREFPFAPYIKNSPKKLSEGLGISKPRPITALQPRERRQQEGRQGGRIAASMPFSDKSPEPAFPLA